MTSLAAGSRGYSSPDSPFGAFSYSVTIADLQAELEKLRRRNAKLKAESSQCEAES
jgi:hypothetical protein